MYAHTSVHLYAHVRSLVRSHVHSSVHSFALRSSPRPLATRTPYVHRVFWSYKSIVYEALKKAKTYIFSVVSISLGWGYCFSSCFVLTALFVPCWGTWGECYEQSFENAFRLGVSDAQCQREASWPFDVFIFGTLCHVCQHHNGGVETKLCHDPSTPHDCTWCPWSFGSIFQIWLGGESPRSNKSNPRRFFWPSK